MLKKDQYVITFFFSCVTLFAFQGILYDWTYQTQPNFFSLFFSTNTIRLANNMLMSSGNTGIFKKNKNMNRDKENEVSLISHPSVIRGLHVKQAILVCSIQRYYLSVYLCRYNSYRLTTLFRMPYSKHTICFYVAPEH